MITRSDIRQNAGPSAYKKGIDIYNYNKIKEFEITENGEFDCINAIVKGSGRNSYEVSIAYDAERDTIEDIDCECPAFIEYYGICKHCVAVLLRYVNEKEKENKLFRYQAEEEAIRLELAELTRRSGDTAAPPVPPQRATTPAMKKLLSNQVLKRTLPMLPDSEYGKVRLEARLKCDISGIQMECKIGVGHMYVLKDIFDLVRAVEKSETVSYGKKLTFLHGIDAFAPEDRPLVQFLCNWVQKNQSRYIQSSYYSYYSAYSLPKLRQIPLSPSDLEDFLDTAAIQETVLAAVAGQSEREWQLTGEEVPREMTITGTEDGIEVSINHLFGYQGSQVNIYFHEDKIYRIPRSKLEPIREFLDCMAELPKRMVYIQREDIPVFCRELLPVMEQHFLCKKVNFDESEYGVLPVSFEIYLDAPQRDRVTCEILAIYGDERFNICDKKEHLGRRDLVKETEMNQIVSSLFLFYDDQKQQLIVEGDEDRIYELLVYGIPRLRELGDVYVSDQLKRLKVIPAPKVAVGVSIAGDLLELKLISEDMPKEQLLEILSRYHQKRKFYRLKNGDFVNIEGEEIEALLELKQGLHLSESQMKQETIKLPRYRALYLDAELKERPFLSATKDKSFKALVRNMKTVEDNDFDIPVCLEHVLREYQKRGYLWIKTLKYNGFGGILADDMGLGKTLQVICFLLAEALESDPGANRKTLIVCPASLVFNWNSEIGRFAPQLPVKMVIGTASERQEILENSGPGDILVTSYDLLKRDIEAYSKMSFYCQVIDEAQYIKNHNTQAAQAVKSVHAAFKLALTGTPIENRLSELWSIFDYLMPGFLYSYQRFHDELELPISQRQEEKAVRRLQKMIRPFVLRRLKKEVLTDLPDKLEEHVYANMEREQQQLYDAHVKRLQLLLGKQSDEEFKHSKIQVLSELTKLRQLCCDPALLYRDYHSGSAKVDVCMELIQNAISGGHKILLFSQFTSMLENLQFHLRRENISFYTLTGATSKEERARLVEAFNKDEVSAFCISLKAGGTGLNLASADIVIHFDPWWNLAVQNQATDRAHRIGQKNVVSVYKLIVKGTIEENITKLQDKKKELTEQILSGDGMSLGSFTREELLELLAESGDVIK